eukprot:m51a1_g10911 hypothetical protein (172) ;mRNA; f:68501-69182
MATSGEYYDSIAKGYAGLHRQEQLEKIALFKSKIELRPTDILLDVGCGPEFADWPVAEVHGVDPSAELLKYAQKKGVVTKHGRAEDMGQWYTDNQFDVVVSLTAIQNFDDLELGLGEVARVGKDRFCLSYLKRSPKAEKIEEIMARLFDIKERIEQRFDIVFVASKKAQAQ